MVRRKKVLLELLLELAQDYWDANMRVDMKQSVLNKMHKLLLVMGGLRCGLDARDAEVWEERMIGYVEYVARSQTVGCAE